MLEYDIYVSGKMTGLPNYNKEHFNRITDHLESLGYTVFNPATINGEPDWEWSDYMRVALQGQMKSLSILMLTGYELSKGACIELDLARRLNMNIAFEKDLHGNRMNIYLPKLETTESTK